MNNGLLAVIPARGGSKRIPNKNVLPFFGHPMLAYAVAAARNCGLFERIVVSTDSLEIGEAGAWYGAQHIPRPPELASDTAELVDVSLHVVRTLASEGFQPRALCQLMPNCPLRRAADISCQYQEFERTDRKFQISVVPYRVGYPQWALVQDREGARSMFGPEFMVNSQNLSKTYCPTGAVWWARTHDFIEQRAFYGRPYYLSCMDANRGIDIDDADDLALADLLVRGLRDRDGTSPLETVAEKPFRPQDVNA